VPFRTLDGRGSTFRADQKPSQTVVHLPSSNRRLTYPLLRNLHFLIHCWLSILAGRHLGIHSRSHRSYVSANVGYEDPSPVRRLILFPSNNGRVLHLESCGIKEPLQIQPKDLGLLSGHGWIRPAIAGQWRVHSKVVNLESDRCGVGIKGIKIVSRFESAGYSASAIELRGMSRSFDGRNSLLLQLALRSLRCLDRCQAIQVFSRERLANLLSSPSAGGEREYHRRKVSKDHRCATSHSPRRDTPRSINLRAQSLR